MVISDKDLKDFLDEKAEFYNRKKFIQSDPIQIPHQYLKKEDIEIAGFLSATIAWGNRTIIIRNSKRMMEIMDNSPFDFIMNHSKKELETIEVEGTSANGACHVTMTADMKTKEVRIDETLLSSEAHVIENAIKVAVNEALEDAKDTSAKKLKAVTGGITDGLPGF